MYPNRLEDGNKKKGVLDMRKKMRLEVGDKKMEVRGWRWGKFRGWRLKNGGWK